MGCVKPDSFMFEQRLFHDNVACRMSHVSIGHQCFLEANFLRVARCGLTVGSVVAQPLTNTPTHDQNEVIGWQNVSLSSLFHKQPPNKQASIQSGCSYVDITTCDLLVAVGIRCCCAYLIDSNKQNVAASRVGHAGWFVPGRS
jgi:hypothetical protein